MAEIRPLAVATHPHNNSLVVLIHGILSSRFGGWAPAVDMIQSLFDENARDAILSSYDYYAFGYRSALVQPPFESFFPQLRELVSRPRYDSVVLVGHSQGGVLAKLFLLDERENGRLHESKIDIVITLDTPHRGPTLVPYLLAVIPGVMWNTVPVLRRTPVFRQAADLARWSKNLRRLAREWNATNFPPDPCPAEPQRRHLRSYAVPGSCLPILNCKVVVGKKSARGFRIDRQLPGPKATSFGLGHGVGAMAGFRESIFKVLSGHQAEAIERLCGELPALPATALESVAREACETAGLRCDVETWQRRLRQGFRRRPLRGLASAQEAAHKFMRLRQPHP